MRAFLIGLVVFAIVAGGALGIGWFIQASQAKKSFEQTIAAINQNQTYITYQSIETSGFPTHVNVSIIRPHFTGRIDTLVKAFLTGMPAGPLRDKYLQQAQTLPEWNEDASLEGSLEYGINAFSDVYTMEVNGTWNHVSKIGTQTISSVSQSSGSSFCTLTLHRDDSMLSTLWNFKTLARDQATFAHDFRLVDCTSQPHTTSDATTHEALITSGGGRFYVTSTPQGKQQQLRIYINSKDGEITAAGDKAIAQYLRLLSPSTIPTKLSSYGKQNLTLDFSYAGPADMHGDLKNQPLDIQLTQFTLTNQLYNANIAFHLANSASGENRMAAVTLKATSNATEAYDAQMKEMVSNTIQQLYNDHQDVQLQHALSTYKPEELTALVIATLPDLHSLGTMTQAVDATYQGNANFTAGDINLANFELSATPYGITGKGTSKLTAGNPIPVANLTLNCTHCLQLVDDATAYAARLQKVVSAFQPQNASLLAFDPARVEGIKSFLSALAAQPAGAADKSVFTYTLISDGSMNITINGKRIDEVMQLYNQNVAYRPQPAAQPPAAP